MLHDAGDRIFLVRIHRTTDQARRLQAVIAAHRKMKPLRVRIESTFDFANAPPIDVSRISVLLIAGDNAAFAANTLRHIEVKTILLAWLERPLRNQGNCGGEINPVQAIAHGGRRHAAHYKRHAVFPCSFYQWQRHSVETEHTQTALKQAGRHPRGKPSWQALKTNFADGYGPVSEELL